MSVTAKGMVWTRKDQRETTECKEMDKDKDKGTNSQKEVESVNDTLTLLAFWSVWSFESL